MAPSAIDVTQTRGSFRSPPQTAPGLGMRGGLGKTLLIAFLLLAIVPLGLLALLTNNQIQRDTRQKLIISLETMLSLKEAHLMDWVESYEQKLGLLTNGQALVSDQALVLDQALSARLVELQADDPALLGLLLMDQASGAVIASSGAVGSELEALPSSILDGQRLLILPPATAGEQPLSAVIRTGNGRRLVGLLQWDSLQQIITESDDPTGGVSTSLITSNGLMISDQGLDSLPLDDREALPQSISRVLQERSGSGAYTDLEGEPVFGAYRWNPDLQVALLAQQSQTQALATGNALTAMVVGATLAVALITAAIAAVVTRRITRPIVQLTETAAWMARGDLDQQVPIVRRDEIGVLARAFNRMATDLRLLYENLEAKVAERTRQLEEANERTLHHAMQLALSAEVARIATSIRDVDSLLTTVAELLGDTFELYHVSIYLLDEGGRWVVWQAGSSDARPSLEREQVGGESLVGHVAADGQRRVVRALEPGTDNAADDASNSVPGMLQPPVQCAMAVPLRFREQVLGVLYLQSKCHDDFGENDQMVYQSLADQISVAIKNAQAYALERETVEKLRELDRIQAQFLTNMSHALRTPLNSVIGFSRIVLKELDGPLNDLQHTDLTTIYDSGRQLLGLINDMLELSHLELGTAPFSLAEVDLAEIIEGVMATARALALSKPVQLYEEVPQDLPPLYTDGQRLRQVILALLTNAVKYTDEGSVRLRVATDDGHIIISVHDTGMGIPEAERARVFSSAQYGEADGVRDVPAFGLAISKRVVEKLGGEIWVESEKDVGSTFTFTLPVRPDKAESETGGVDQGNGVSESQGDGWALDLAEGKGGQ